MVGVQVTIKNERAHEDEAEQRGLHAMFRVTGQYAADGGDHEDHDRERDHGGICLFELCLGQRVSFREVERPHKRKAEQADGAGDLRHPEQR